MNKNISTSKQSTWADTAWAIASQIHDDNYYVDRRTVAKMQEELEQLRDKMYKLEIEILHAKMETHMGDSNGHDK
jgi:hypothetical protein